MDFIKKIIISFFIIVFSHSAYCISSIKFGIINFYPPFIFSGQGGQVYGFDIELAQAICSNLNAQCTYTRMPLHELFDALKNNQIDAIISAINITPERKKIFDFTIPYYKSTASFVGLANSTIQISPQGLKNKTIGVIKASIFYDYLKHTYPGIVELKTYRNAAESIEDLAKSKIDLVMLDTPTAKYWVGTSHNLFQIVGSVH